PLVQSMDCGNTVLSRAAPPSGITYYWQSNANGTSTSDSSGTISRSSSGTQYLRARNESGIWSVASSSVAYTVTPVAPLPPAPTITHTGCGVTVLLRAESPVGTTWYWQDAPNGTS